MIIKIVIGSLLALSAVDAVAGNMYIFKDKYGQQLLINNVSQSEESDKFTKKIKTTYYKDTNKESIKPISQKQPVNERDNRNKDTYVKVDYNVQSATKVVRQPKSVTTDNVAKFYKPLDWLHKDKNNFEYLKSTEDVKVIEDNDINKTYNLMLANGYILIGSSQFNDRNLPNSIFISQAKKLGASYVSIYKKNSSTVSYDVNDDLNNLDYAYQYVVDFYVKDNFFKKPNMLGINFGEIPLEKRVQLQRNTGAYVGNVVKDSRAYFANIVLEDVIIAVNGKEVRGAEDLDKLKESELKMTKNLNLTIIRLINNEPKEIQILVSFN